MEIQREAYLQRLLDRRGSGLVKAVTGLRGAGKSYLLLRQFRARLLAEGSRVLAVALDDRANKALRDPDRLLAHLREALSDGRPCTLLLDEVGRVKDFPDVLTSLLHFPNADIYVTAPCTEPLTSQTAPELRGRVEEIRLRPLSFREFSAAWTGDADDALGAYLTYGGLPAVLTYHTAQEKADALTALLKELYLPDISQRYALRDRKELEVLLGLLAGLTGGLTNPTKLAKALRSNGDKAVTDKTIKRYLGQLESSFFLSRSERWDIKGQRYINTPAKYYFEDLGLLSAAAGFRGLTDEQAMEALLYDELRLRGFQVDVGVVETQERTGAGKARRQLTVDFVAARADRRYYLQFAPWGGEGERKALNSIGDSFKKLIVVPNALSPRRDERGILTLGLRRFLLDEHSLDL